jgi:hypothetical protein
MRVRVLLLLLPHPRALLCGAGRCMREGAGAAAAAASTAPAAAESSGGSSAASRTDAAGALAPSGGVVVVDLPYSSQQLQALLEALYGHTLDVSRVRQLAGSVSGGGGGRRS